MYTHAPSLRPLTRDGGSSFPGFEGEVVLAHCTDFEGEVALTHCPDSEGGGVHWVEVTDSVEWVFGSAS